MTVGEVTPGYELWRPNREKSENVATKALMALLLALSGALVVIITIGGFTVLEGGTLMGVVCLAFAGVYFLFALLTLKWSRGVLPVAAACAVFMTIFAAVAVPSWFERDQAGYADTLIPAPLLGVLTVIMIPLQIAVIVVALIGFQQEWHVEEERPIGSGTEYGAGPAEPSTA